MAKKTNPTEYLLRWSDYVPATNVQDPLGLNLRGLTRLGERLLHCITSITPRARYFSFIPWCVLDYQSREKGKPHALGLREAIVLRENALTLACVSHHNGDTCVGGALVGTNEAKRWLNKGNADADLKKLRFAKNPALDAYFASLVNLGCFAELDNDAVAEVDAAEVAADEREFTFDDVRLSPIGLELANRYESEIAGLPVLREFVGGHRRCSVKSLANFGSRGGLCELTEAAPADRSFLRELFFGIGTPKGRSHQVRRQSLLLILELCRQFSAEKWLLDESTFTSAIYFGELVGDDARLDIELADPFVDIGLRWRMFYFHHFMGVALEGMFSWLIAQLGEAGLAGVSLDELVLRLNDNSVQRTLSEICGRTLKKPFGDMTPSDLLSVLSLPHGDLSVELGNQFDVAVRATHPIAEDTLEFHVRNNEFSRSSSGTGLALPMILLSTTLTRYARWQTSNYGMWLASVSDNPCLDLVPPIVANGLVRTFGRWWHCKWSDIARFVLSRYIVRQHQAMSYEKSWSGDRCLLQVDGPKVFLPRRQEGFERIGMGNPRLGSAIQILIDLGLLVTDKDGVTRVTKDGKAFVRRELAKEVAHEVSSRF